MPSQPASVAASSAEPSSGYQLRVVQEVLLALFHLKLVAAAAAGLADPVVIVDAQRRSLLLGLREAQRAALAEPDGSVAGLPLGGVVLRLQADLRWLEACVRHWASPRAGFRVSGLSPRRGADRA